MRLVATTLDSICKRENGYKYYSQLVLPGFWTGLQCLLGTNRNIPENSRKSLGSSILPLAFLLPQPTHWNFQVNNHPTGFLLQTGQIPSTTTWSPLFRARVFQALVLPAKPLPLKSQPPLISCKYSYNFLTGFPVSIFLSSFPFSRYFIPLLLLLHLS